MLILLQHQWDSRQQLRQHLALHIQTMATSSTVLQGAASYKGLRVRRFLPPEGLRTADFIQWKPGCHQ